MDIYIFNFDIVVKCEVSCEMLVFCQIKKMRTQWNWTQTAPSRIFWPHQDKRFYTSVQLLLQQRSTHRLSTLTLKSSKCHLYLRHVFYHASCSSLAHRAILHAGFGVGGTTRWWWRLNRRCQSAEETSNKSQTQTTPSAEHGPAIAMAYIIWEAEHVTWVAGKFKVDASHASTQGDDAKRTCK